MQRYKRLTHQLNDENVSSSKSFVGYLLEKAKSIFDIDSSAARKEKSEIQVVKKKRTTIVQHLINASDPGPTTQQFSNDKSNYSSSIYKDDNMISSMNAPISSESYELYKRYEGIYDNNLILVSNCDDLDEFYQNECISSMHYPQSSSLSSKGGYLQSESELKSSSVEQNQSESTILVHELF